MTSDSAALEPGRTVAAELMTGRTGSIIRTYPETRPDQEQETV